VRFNCKRVILVDQAESPLNDLWLELKGLGTNVEIKPVVANVTHKERMRQIFQCANPAVVFHAAAYKHVPMMEIHPSTAVVTNVLGTKVCADLAAEIGVSRFIMISTDKAVNPTNVMGATKRAAEIYIQSLALRLTNQAQAQDQAQATTKPTTKFITTRFGNVLGSNGSVVPLFKRQIEKGGPVTLTHRDITRFFMTIPEACSLVLEAGCTGHGGEIYVFDMGEAVKIYDLAQKMIRLSGKIPNKDIHIVETGLRPGEKLYEELLATTENTIPTYNKKIMIAKVRRYKYEFISPTIDELVDTAIKYDLSKEVVWRLKLLIPEFKSQNSDYCCIDHEIDKNTNLNEAYAQYEVQPLPAHILKAVQQDARQAQQQTVQA
jgi:FlaA1/EpsC-like NDP-sugar epimerase